ncbi:MAG: DUF3048 domain-containing protein [Acidimicrobiales bacterium]
MHFPSFTKGLPRGVRWAAAGLGCLVLAGGVAVGIMAASRPAHARAATGPARAVLPGPTYAPAALQPARRPAATDPTTAAARRTPPTTAPARCPLTGTPAPGGVAPNRPAVAVKVDDYPSARPQYGLDAADIVFEEPVEGGITRFVAVFQCHQAARIEPVRSARLVDALLLPQLGRPVFGFAGGIGPSVAAVDGSGARVAGVDQAPGAYRKDPARFAPHELETSTAALLAAAGHPSGPPPPLFTYAARPRPGAATPSLHLHFSDYSDVWWRWDAHLSRYRRFYGDVPALLGDGHQIAAANVVVEQVQLTPSPYVEDATGVHEWDVGVVGSGPAEVARDGTVVTGRWERPSAAAPTRLVDSAGQAISLAPGPTWVELLPATAGASPAP